ncbi:hypothetical protein [Gluconacetobacter tumulicola]|uniref:Uncharacterized protein n=1 Tax=Gluconacetobacter tumulicola TaxID=1017177 RepID=A0A7W4JG53_9PROT|nr:hypothetical protein [Gluconacetobacter tumulicola]MBB2180576.1 hypothetical protein [Gluconacetobacter tumulicola]
MNLVQDASERTVSEWHGAIRLEAYAEQIAEIAERRSLCRFVPRCVWVARLLKEIAKG